MTMPCVLARTEENVQSNTLTASDYIDKDSPR